MRLNFYIDSREVCQYGPLLLSTDERHFIIIYTFKVCRWCNVYDKKSPTNCIKHVHSCFTDSFTIILAKLYTSKSRRLSGLSYRRNRRGQWTEDTLPAWGKRFPQRSLRGLEFRIILLFSFNRRKKGLWNCIWGNCLPLMNEISLISFTKNCGFAQGKILDRALCL